MAHGERRTSATGAAAFAALVVLIALPLFVYREVGTYEFIDFDDGAYVYENPHVKGGVTSENVRWALTASHAANWHPLTWISHMLDVELFGLNAGRHHQVNVALHVANVALLFLVLRSLTGAFWRSALVAALFAVHPLNVENVAWVAERKTLLSTVFGLLAVAAYVAWTRRRGPARYALLSVLFAFSLMSKPMLVTLPVLLLLLDFWPLRRIEEWRMSVARPLIVEKLPLFGISLASSAITIAAQSHAGATTSADAFPLGERVLNAFVSFVWYLWKTAVPANLAIFYPHPANTGATVSRPVAFAAMIGLAIVTAVLLWMARRTPFAITGWTWYLVALLPMIGIIQVGGQSRADRYAYLPLIGIFILIIWAGADLAQRMTVPKEARTVVAIGILLAFAVIASRQTAVWENRSTLYGHAIAVDGENWLAWNNLGMTQFERGELQAALHSFTAAAWLNPSMSIAAYNAGSVLSRQQRYAEAILWYGRSLQVDPSRAEAWTNVGIAHQALGNERAAVFSFTRALTLRPDDRWAVYGLASIACRRGSTPECETWERQLAAVAPELSFRAILSATAP